MQMPNLCRVLHESRRLPHPNHLIPPHPIPPPPPSSQRGEFNKFNPITGNQKAADGGWRPATNPWEHQRPGMRPASTISGMEPKSVSAEWLKVTP